MALDPSIILGLQQPNLHQVDPVQQYAAQAQAREQAQTAQLRGIEIQNALQAQRSHAAIEDALSKATVLDLATGKVNFDKAGALQTLKSGGFGQEALGLQEGWQKQDLAAQKSLLDNQKLSLENQGLHIQAMGQLASGILSLPMEQQAAAYMASRDHLIQTHAVTPDEVPEQYSAPFLQQLQTQSMTASEVLKAQNDKVERDQKSIELQQQAQNNQANQMLSADRNKLEKRGQDLTHADRQREISIQAGRLQFDKQKQNFDQGGAVETQAQQIAKGELPLPPQSRVNPYTRAVTQRALEINPHLSTNLYTTMQDYYSSKGKTNGQITTLNKLADHLVDLRDLSDKAGFSPTGLTTAGNNLRLGNQLFSNEDVKFLAGTGVAHEGELNELRKNTLSPFEHVRQGALDTLSKFTADAAHQVANQFTRDTRMPFDTNRAFTDNTKKLMSGGSQPEVSPSTHVFHLDSWKAKNPGGNPEAAAAYARQQGYTVVQ